MNNPKRIARKAILTALAVAVLLYFVPIFAIVYLCAGLIDVMRNTRRDAMVFERYFLGNGIPTWLLSPFNLVVDLLSYRNPGIYRMADLPPEWRAEVEAVLDTFQARKTEIISDIDGVFEAGRRGMYVFKWYGKENTHNIEAFKGDFKYIRTIAVSVFSGRESTSFHFGPLRLTLRVLYNLSPVRSDDIFIECGNRKHYWHHDPLFIFDDTLIHRSVNQNDARRYCVFMDIIRPTPFPRLLAVLLYGVAFLAEKINAVFYRNWKMLRPAAKPASQPAGVGGRASPQSE